ncbi:MAG: hypothetical protein AABX39_04490 [Nanoarchaeota archaeon]
MATKTAATALIKKKKWTPVIAPKWMDEALIGETHVENNEQAIGKTIVASLGSITGDPQKQFTNLKFKMVKAAPDHIQTELIEYQLTPTAVKKAARKGRAKIEDSLLAKSKDGQAVRIKYILMTRGKGRGSLLAALQKKARQWLANELSKMTFDQFMNDLIFYKIQKSLSQALRKIYPVSVAEVRWALLTTFKDGKLIEPTVEEAKPVEKKEEVVVDQVQEIIDQAKEAAEKMQEVAA